MSKIIINANREGYSLDQVRRTMTVSDLIEYLSQFEDDTPVYIGNDPQSYGWYTYGGIDWDDLYPIPDDDPDDE